MSVEEVVRVSRTHDIVQVMILRLNMWEVLAHERGRLCDEGVLESNEVTF